VVLQWSYSGLTVVLQWCYSGLTVVLQWSYSNVSRQQTSRQQTDSRQQTVRRQELHAVHKGARGGVVHNTTVTVPEVLQECDKSVLRA
jgi:hypothetical protein